MSQTSPETETLWSAIRQRDANINGAFSALNAIEAQLHEMRSLKGWRLNLIRQNLERAKAALRTPVDTAGLAQSPREKALEEAALDFVRKVERGDARSTASYAAFKAALSMSSTVRS